MLFHLARFFLLLDVLIYCMVGSFLYFGPKSVGIVGLDFDTPETITAIRVYGGFFYATAIIGSFGVVSLRWTLQSLVAVSIITGCVVAARLSGIVMDGVDERQLGELRDESLGLILALCGMLCYWLHSRRMSQTTATQKVNLT